ncbi:Na/Pi cotransporter family protein [Bacteroides finegoldii]|jgi:phosphate:Na+ symporter|uniref:Na/Pi cotransporter family protein n=4 Tax=Bacteroides TaxID=816 RepID=A0A7J4YP23_9BACE|nr:Na/Pi cotransporter family protein [Bacteroides finegoldii]EEX44012.1 Na/Pi-cotransporter II-like protein [Bacteroides finegoldii DSM 17565]KAA5216514.1 Na/Pi cotransporter family protein [Bacteroides finegoldii]KAA5220854.1 Na/Pi cotransporter family protein [Bacteroides finegoldii]KAA5225632.1 Na/Pi cotransporter family protein [Bacteroides finegoldii]KAA5230149.1 Na/Pi cotransporter family protein [Bacteroides finegoldii]
MEYSFYDFLKLIGSLGLFLYGMKIMSEGLQKVAGDRLRSILTAMTTNRVTGVLTGVLITALIQSSSATTVMVVSFVNAGLLTLAESISVIMGANIGTTVTAWIISIFGFKVDMAAFALPLLAIALPLIFSGKSNRKSIGEFIFGFSFLFMGLSYLKANAPDLNANPEMLAFVQNYTDMGFFSILLFLFIGTILTMIVQASAATMAITLIMCANGWISLELGAALVLGENIGTTITANLAALTANTQAKRAALAHFVFNVFGVIWVLIIFHPFMQMVNWVVDTFFQSSDPEVAISYKLSAFHSIFNICNVCILIWGVKLIERTVCALIHPKEEDEEPRLRFITGGMLSTAELSILQARKEIHLFAERTHRMFGMVQDLLHTEKDDDFNKLFSRIEKYENISDNMELEIANYLNQVSEGRLSSESKLQIRAMLREVTEIESIGDSCYNLARTINRKRQTNQDFTEKQYEHIHFMMKLTNDALAQMIVVVEKPEHQSIDINKSFNIENEINNYRNQLKNQNILDVNNKEYDYQMGVYYMDIIAECEKLGDYVVNVVEASSDVKEKKAS